ncbi:hypothetical protein EV2_005742 [Malus domestica]
MSDMPRTVRVGTCLLGSHRRSVLITAANSLRLRQKHDKELQNNKLQLLEFDNGSVAVVPVNPTSTVARKSWRKSTVRFVKFVRAK